MHHAIGGYRERPDVDRFPFRELDELEAEPSPHSRGARKEHLHRVVDPPLQVGRSGHGQGPRAAGDELGVQDEKGYPPEVVAVQVRDQHDVDRRGVDPESLHGDERGRTTIDEERRVLGAHVDAGMESPPAPEGVTAPQKPDVSIPHDRTF